MIYLVRHGETVWNREGRMQGRLDSPLTDEGEVQARRIGETLRALIDHGASFDVVVSPLGRARRTAEIICKELGWDARACSTDDRLRELSLGEWDGLIQDEIEARFPGARRRRRENHWHHVPPGGESYEMVAARATDWLDGIAPDRQLVVVAHGAVGRVLRGLYSGLSRVATVALDEPQDAIFGLHGGKIDRIVVGAPM